MWGTRQGAGWLRSGARGSAAWALRAEPTLRGGEAAPQSGARSIPLSLPAASGGSALVLFKRGWGIGGAGSRGDLRGPMGNGGAVLAARPPRALRWLRFPSPLSRVPVAARLGPRQAPRAAKLGPRAAEGPLPRAQNGGCGHVIPAGRGMMGNGVRGHVAAPRGWAPAPGPFKCLGRVR